MYGFYEHRPEVGQEFDADGEVDVIEDVYEFDEDEGAWVVRAEESGMSLVRYEDGEWIGA